MEKLTTAALFDKKKNVTNSVLQLEQQIFEAQRSLKTLQQTLINENKLLKSVTDELAKR